jgi:hypothetical protein
VDIFNHSAQFIFMLQPKKRKHMTAKKILDAYKSGERDFSEVVCNNDSFDNFQLPGIIFKKADLSFCSFYGTNLEGADFSQANLEWTGFIRANLKRANFEKARCIWSRFNESQLEKTSFRGADLSWSLFFNTNLYAGADLTGAITATLATDPSQITEEGMRKLAEKLGIMKGKIEPELLARLQLIAGSTKEKTGAAASDTHAKSGYGAGASGDSAYSGLGKGTPGDYHTAGGAKGVEYGAVGAYTKKKKKDPYDK